ncbi:DNA polymerase [Desulfonatronum parangueonense]
MFEQLRKNIALGVYGKSVPISQKNTDSLKAGGVNAPCAPNISWMQMPTQGTTECTIGIAQPSSAQIVSLATFGTGLEYVTDPARAAEIVASLQGKLCGFDIETAKHSIFKTHDQAGLNPHLSKPRLVQLYSGTGDVYVFDLFRIGTPCLERLNGIDLVAYNAVFEMQHMLHVGFPLPGIRCAMLMANTLTNKRPKLIEVVPQYLDGLVVLKDEQKSDWSVSDLSAAQIEYAALDAVLALKLHEILQVKIKDVGRERLYSLLHGAQWPVAQMIHKGLNVDIAACQAVSEQVCVQIQEVRDVAMHHLHGVKNLNSPDQIAAWLERNLTPSKIKAWPKTDSGGLSTAKDDLENLRSHPGIDAFLWYKKLVKLNTGFLQKMQELVVPTTGRLHPNFKIAGAETGRMTCSKPNVQQVPRGEMREMFTAGPGEVNVGADFSQMETRIAAQVSGDQEMLGCYDRGDDLHILTAMAITGKQAGQIAKSERNAAKAANFGLLYGQGALGLKNYARTGYGVHLTKKEAADIREKFFEKYPIFHQWQMQTTRSAARCSFVETPSGRRRYLKADKYYGASLNTPIQGAGAEIFYAAMGRLPTYLAGLDATLVNVVHDEMILEASEKDAPAAKAALERAMVEGFLEIFPEASTRDLVEAKIGKSWAEAK